MILTFLNVGQGDSIVLEWADKEKTKTAIVDCKSNLGKNPVIEYLIAQNIKFIEFLIISHPHSDHFSGTKELLEHCVENDIVIKYLYHTATVSPNRIKTAVKGTLLTTEVTELYLLLSKLKTKGLITVCPISEMGFDISLSSEWSLRVLSPSFVELDEYSKNVNYSIIDQDEDSGNEPFANYLSTVLMLHNDKGYVLLTSDTVIDTFFRLDKKYKSLFNSKKLILGQIPHHGSRKNYKPIFWKNKNPTKELVPAVISVGPNGYRHPHKEVIENLTRLGYDIFTTQPLKNISETNSINSSFANMYSKPIPINNKITFEINGLRVVSR